jgi:hypothetical protein
MPAINRPKWRWPLLFVLVSLAIPATISVTSSNATAPGPAGVVSAQAQTGRIGPGRLVTPTQSAKPFVPTKAQLAARASAMAGLAKHKAPSLGRHTTVADVEVNGGPEVDPKVKQAPGDFKVHRQSLVNSTCSGCGQSVINEPSVANNGRFIVEASNWNIAYTTKGGAATIPWNNLSPYSFSSGFCCDQEVTYDPSRNIFLLLQLDYAGEGASSNGLALSVTSGNNPGSWCTYKFAGAIGGGATSTPDFPKIAVANNNVYLTWNEYPPNATFARSGLARMPIDSIATCAGFNYSYLTRTTEFTFALSKAGSSLDQFYWVSNWFLDGTTNGSNMRIFYWPENSGSYFYVTRAVNAYTFGNVACGGSPDWCNRLDPRYESVTITRAEYRAQASAGFAGDSILEIATSAGPSGFSNGKNYIVFNYFKLNALTYIGNDQLYSTSTNFGYPGCAVNVHGYTGCAMQEGTTAPGGFILLKDNLAPIQAWAYSFQIGGISPTNGGGDYVVTSPFNPAVGPFQTVLWRKNGATVEPYYIVWGRTSESSAYKRWKGK